MGEPEGSPFFAPCLPLCAALRSKWSSCRARQFGANLPRFWAKGKRGYWELISAKGDFDRCEKCLQVKYRLRTAGKIPQIPAVRGFFADAGQRQTALVCGYENNKCQDSLRKKEILHRCWYQLSAKVYERRIK